MIKYRKDMRTAEKSNLCGGHGDLVQLHLFEPEETSNRVSMICEFSFDPGDEIGLHQHNKNAEIYYILEGDFELLDNGEKRKVTTGDAIFAADGDFHSIRNVGNCEGVLLAILFPN